VCVNCTQPNGGLIFGLLLLSGLWTLTLFRLSQDITDGSTLSFLYFVSTLRLVLGQNRTWLSWYG
jgi:hypothetical protein